MDSLATICKVPKEWPALRSPFKHAGFIKTAELLLFAGDAGLYVLRFADIDQQYTRSFQELVHLLRLLMQKVSTPGDRAEISRKLPELMTRLEIMLPCTWARFVHHVLCFHTLQQMEAAGPYMCCSMLDFER